MPEETSSRPADETAQLRERLASLELGQLAMQRAFEAAAQSDESQLAVLNDVYNALFTAHAGLKAIVEQLAGDDVAAARALAHGLLLRLREYDPEVRPLPFADVPAGAHFYYGGAEFRKYKNYHVLHQTPANAINTDDGSPAWFAEDVLVTPVDNN